MIDPDFDSAGPSPRLEERVVETLRGRGLLGAPAAAARGTLAPRWLWPGLIAAGLLLFVGGFALGRRPAATPAAGLSQYTLLLYEGPEFKATDAEEPALVREYSAWAGELAARGRLVAGEKLGDRSWTLGAWSGPVTGVPTGFFVIAARDENEALAIAGSCPHLRHGGSIAVRPIEPT